MLHGKKIIVVMPAYHAEQTLEQTYNEIPHDIVDDVILVDDCSRDNTVEKAKAAGINHVIVHERNLGYGGNQKTCYNEALNLGADIVVMLHPDYQYSPKLVTAMASMIASGEFDVVLASRILGMGALKGGMPFYKYVANRLLTFVENLLLGCKLSEFHTGYRAFSREVLTGLPLDRNSDDFVFDNQMLAQAVFFGYRIGEISCPTKYFPEASSINFWRSMVYGVGVLFTAIKFRIHKMCIKEFPLFINQKKNIDDKAVEEMDDKNSANISEKTVSLINVKDLCLLAGLVLAGLAVRTYFIQFCKFISADGAAYATLGKAFIADGWFGGPNHPPLYPALVGLMSLIVPDLELAGRIVSVIMGSFLVVPLYFLGTTLYNKKTALMVCLLVIVWPSIRSWSTEVMTQATYMTLVLSGIYFFWIAFERQSKVLSILTGFFMGLACLTRPEVLAIFFSISVVLFVRGVSSKIPFKNLFFFFFLAWVSYLAVLFPYLYELHEQTGRWQLTGKSGMALSLTLDKYYGKVDTRRKPNFKGLGYLEILKKHPHVIRENTKNNFKKAVQSMLPWYGWLLAFIGIISGRWRQKDVFKRLFLLGTFTPLLIIIVFFFIGPEYTQPYLPILFLWIGFGALCVERKLLALVNLVKWPGIKRVLVYVPISLIFVTIFSLNTLVGQIPAKSNKPYHYRDDGGRYDEKKIGLLLDKYLPKDAKIMTRSSKIMFYSNREYVDIPQAGFSDILRTARNSGVNYLVVNGALIRIRPQLKLLFKPFLMAPEKIFRIYRHDEGFNPLPYLKLFLLYNDPASTGVAVYRIGN